MRQAMLIFDEKGTVADWRVIAESEQEEVVVLDGLRKLGIVSGQDLPLLEEGEMTPERRSAIKRWMMKTQRGGHVYSQLRIGALSIIEELFTEIDRLEAERSYPGEVCNIPGSEGGWHSIETGQLSCIIELLQPYSRPEEELAIPFRGLWTDGFRSGARP